ncbi:hypothetical protein CMI38_02055 [Candidatus Pacearchaeota archaeon]|nr:hypothetical protein [Candidatus Pacearchaeota archaeon]|tara:strand:- start:351 stop:836 length:486 start_codon:yes stop_codon:yes gene_type:complete
MIGIRNESDFRNWFIENYKDLGFSKIVASSTLSFPDFVMIESEKESRVELETKSSNFILHKHPADGVDKVVCIVEDVELGVPTIIVEGLHLISFEEESTYSNLNRVYNLFKSNKILTTSEVASLLGISKGAAERNLMELTLDKKIERIKKEGINLWLRELL